MKKFSMLSTVLIIAFAAYCCGDGGNKIVQPLTWGTVERVGTDGNGYAGRPQIAVDQEGNALAVWEQYNGAHDVWTNHYNGADWGTAKRLEIDDAGYAAHPLIAFDSAGNAIAVWQQYDGNRFKINTKRYDGEVWGTEEIISINENEDAFGPKFGFDAVGNAIAVWSQPDGISSSDIWGNRFDGISWGTPELIENNSSFADGLDIAVDSDGNALAVWYQRDKPYANIWANRFDGTSWGTPELIDDNESGGAWNPKITCDAAGNAIAVWVQKIGNHINVWANRFDGTAWGAPELIGDNELVNAWDPKITCDAAGNAIAVWVQKIGNHNNVWANCFDGTAWGIPELIEEKDGDSRDPQIAIHTDGNVIAVWSQIYGFHYGIWANQFDGKVWGKAQLIESDHSLDAESPQISINAFGDAIVIWALGDTVNSSNIWAVRLE